MRLKVVSSSSKGNAYILSDNTGDSIIIECGMPIKKIQQALDFKLQGVQGCLISHEHL